jgi:monooxygenase
VSTTAATPDTASPAPAPLAAGAAGGGEDPEHLDVLVVGAGLSGVGAAAYLRRRCPWARFAVLEARGAIGGTWDLFRYPGVRSDSDMFTLGYAFRPWDGDKSIADGDAILRYIVETADAEGVTPTIRFGRRVVSAAWSSCDARWVVEVQRVDSGEQERLTCGFLFVCTGYYRYDHGYLPDFPDLDRYTGALVHPQQWPERLDVTGKRVVVIGSGATAMTLVPALARRGAHVTMLQRSPTYVASLPARDPLADAIRRALPARMAGTVNRWMKALLTQGSYQLARRRPSLVRRALIGQLRRQLPDDFDVDTHFTPRYDPWDQRLCVVPDGDLFAALRDGSASVVTDHVERFTERGVLLRSGDELLADVVVTATGLDLLFLGGIELTVDGERVDPAHRLTYRGMMLEGVPNLATAIGYTNASWTLKCDLTCDYVCRLLNRLRATGLRQCTPVNRDPTLEPRPLLELTSGYVTRAMHRFPKQGSRDPWRLHQSFLRDYRDLRLRSVADPALAFSNRTPAGRDEPAGARRGAA